MSSDIDATLLAYGLAIREATRRAARWIYRTQRKFTKYHLGEHRR